MNILDLLEKFFKEWGIPILCAVFLAFLVRKFIFFNVKVPTESMYPTIKPGDKIFVTITHSQESLERGDIVVFKSEEIHEDLIKRLVGLPGDHVEFKADGSVYVNGELLEEDYVKNNNNKEGIFDVPEDSYLFCGDNRANSLDARYWNEPYINYKDIKGEARFIISPFSRWGKLQ